VNKSRKTKLFSIQRRTKRKQGEKKKKRQPGRFLLDNNVFQLGEKLLEHLQDLLLVVNLVLNGLAEAALEVLETFLVCAVEL